MLSCTNHFLIRIVHLLHFVEVLLSISLPGLTSLIMRFEGRLEGAVGKEKASQPNIRDDNVRDMK